MELGIPRNLSRTGAGVHHPPPPERAGSPPTPSAVSLDVRTRGEG